jgi:hypothetical protein
MSAEINYPNASLLWDFSGLLLDVVQNNRPETEQAEKHQRGASTARIHTDEIIIPSNFPTFSFR